MFLRSAVLVWAEQCWMGSQSPPNALNGRWHPWAEPRLDQHLLAGILLELGGRGGVCPTQVDYAAGITGWLQNACLGCAGILADGIRIQQIT